MSRSDFKAFRNVHVTRPHMQLVSQHLKPDEDVGKETHDGMDQVFIIVRGSGIAYVGDIAEQIIKAGDALVVPMGTSHNLRAGPDGMNFWTVYAPKEPGKFEHKPEEIEKTKPIANQLQDAADALADTDYAPSIGDLLQRIEQEGPVPMLVQAAQRWIEFAHIEKGAGRRGRSRPRRRLPKKKIASRTRRRKSPQKGRTGRSRSSGKKAGGSTSKKPKSRSASVSSSSERGSSASPTPRQRGKGKGKKASPVKSKGKGKGKKTGGGFTSGTSRMSRSGSVSSVSSYGSSATTSPVVSPPSSPRYRRSSGSSVSSYSSSTTPSPVVSPPSSPPPPTRRVPAPPSGISTVTTRTPTGISTVTSGTQVTKINEDKVILLEGEIQINHYPW